MGFSNSFSWRSSLKVILISVKAERGKRPHYGKLPFQRHFNFGLLGLASTAFRAGHEVEVWDQDDPAHGDLDELCSLVANSAPDVVGLSCISGFSYPSMLELARSLRPRIPGSLLIAGGMDHVGQIPQRVLADSPEIDAVVVGYGEVPLLTILDNLSAVDIAPGVCTRGRVSPDPAVASLGIPALDYHLFRGFAQVPASVELARGCPFHCSFCVTAGRTLDRRPPDDLADRLLEACIAYGDPALKVYLEAPLATFTRDYLRALRAGLRARGIAPTWRTECRLDTLAPSLAEDLYAAGCRVLDLGLESASPRILEWMNKASNAESYIRCASKLLRALADNNIFAKLNILFYAGETTDTMMETREFLEARRSQVGAIAAGPLYLYPGIADESRILTLLDRSGGSIVEDPEWQARCLRPVNPSRELTFDELLAYSLEFEQDFQTASKYFYQRQWGYFRPGVTYDQFISAVAQAGSENFPFEAPDEQAGFDFSQTA